MLDQKKTEALLAPAFTDETLGRLLMLAVSQAGQEAEKRRRERGQNRKSIDEMNFDKLFDIVERLRMKQTKK